MSACLGEYRPYGGQEVLSICSSGARVTGICDPPHVGTVNHIWVFHKGSNGP